MNLSLYNKIQYINLSFVLYNNYVIKVIRYIDINVHINHYIIYIYIISVIFFIFTSFLA